ncbi:hypothetical protein [Tenacibaculum aiptasiae]|uniref:hypothetical protein n=1 Tax=Tenacibaculum aiptasiae TaxID=426481 RepID=UPI003B5A77EE
MLTAIVGGIIYYLKSTPYVYLINISINLLFILLLFFILKIYSNYKMKKGVFEAIGLGDFFFFGVLAVSFPIISFFVLFSVSLIFSYILFIILKPSLKEKNVPLAGFQALFLIIILGINSLLDIVNLYIL